MAPWIEVARYDYAYLFFTRRSPGERAFEDRQTQVRDWYNYAVQQAVTKFFDMRRRKAGAAAREDRSARRLDAARTEGL